MLPPEKRHALRIPNIVSISPIFEKMLPFSIPYNLLPDANYPHNISFYKGWYLKTCKKYSYLDFINVGVAFLFASLSAMSIKIILLFGNHFRIVGYSNTRWHKMRRNTHIRRKRFPVYFLFFSSWEKIICQFIFR